MLCPVCNIELKIADRQGVEIDYCPKCRGVWLDRGELDKLIERTAQVYGPPAASAARPGQRDEYYVDDDDYDYKRKNDDPYRRDERPYPHGRRRKSFLGEIFDIFD